MRRLRACLAHTRPGGWGHRPGQLCGSAVRRLDAERTKAAKAVRIRGRVTSPVRTRKYGPLAQNRRNGAPQGDALPEDHRLASGAGSETNTRCALRRSMPLALQGQSQISPRGSARERLRTPFVGANGASPTRACCLKIESGRAEATHAVASYSVVVPAQAGTHNHHRLW